MANELEAAIDDSCHDDDYGYNDNSCVVGNDIFGFGSGPNDGALRFDNIDIDKNESINMAVLHYEYSSVGDGSGDEEWIFDVYGIDEDDTDSFSSGDKPWSRSKTTAKISVSEGRPTSGGGRDFDVKSILEEITSRSGWSNGNAVGFTFFDEGSDGEVGAYCYEAESYLAYRTSAEPDFTPTTVTKSAPSLPDAKDYGIKISKPDVNVTDCSEENLYFTTRREQFKVYDEGEITTTRADHTISHNLGYIPAAEVFLETGTERVRLPSLEYVSNAANGYIEITTTQLKIYTSGSGNDVYYYIFLDQIK